MIFFEGAYPHTEAFDSGDDDEDNEDDDEMEEQDDGDDDDEAAKNNGMANMASAKRFNRLELSFFPHLVKCVFPGL